MRFLLACHLPAFAAPVRFRGPQRGLLPRHDRQGLGAKRGCGWVSRHSGTGRASPMAYNKTKSVESAQKYLNLGKVSQAISEYQQILRNEPRDQVTLMTIGDLYVRQGETFQALEYFEQLAQIYLSDGFVTKAIAIYKKIAKLAPEESKALEKLAELYVQQGEMSEARQIGRAHV